MKKKNKTYSKRRVKKKRTRKSLFLLFVAFFIILTAGLFLSVRIGLKIPFFPNFGMENLAKGRLVYSSSALNSNYAATKVVDGNQGSYWEGIGHAIPANITVALDHPYIVNQIVVKLPSSWGKRTEKIEVLGSLDNVTFTRIVAPTGYLLGSATIDLGFVEYRYIRLVISGNSTSPAAQLSEIEIYGANPRVPWSIQSFDVMKYSKDVVCNPPSMATIDSMNDRIASAGANLVAISTPYDNPHCGSSINLTNTWIKSARQRNLHVWHRHMGLSFEGIYDTPKTKNLTAYSQQIMNYVINNPDQFQDGDIFTPTPEPDSAGINGVTYCPTICQFSSADEYNIWIQITQSVVKAAFRMINKDVKVGYYGHSGFIVWGEANPDWTGKGFLTQATVDSMDGVIAMDTYPETYGGTMTKSLDGAHARWPNAKLVIGEWGTIVTVTDSAKIEVIKSTMSAAERNYIDGFNYWNLGPSGNEGVLDATGSALPAYQTVKDFYTGLR